MAPNETRVPGGTVLPGAHPAAANSARPPPRDRADRGRRARGVHPRERGKSHPHHGLPPRRTRPRCAAGPGRPRAHRFRRRRGRLVGTAHRAGPGLRHHARRRPVREPARRPVRVHRAHLGRPRHRGTVGCRLPAAARHATRRGRSGAWPTAWASSGSRCVAGGSLGGMVSLEVALERPDAVGHVVPLGAPAATGAMAIAWNHIQLEIIERLGARGPGVRPPARDDHVPLRRRTSTVASVAEPRRTDGSPSCPTSTTRAARSSTASIRTRTACS